jgi:tetratricopeptide (TPR) repeat protein
VRYPKVTVPYTEYSEYILARKVTLGSKPDPAPMRAFIDKNPSTPLLKTAWLYLSLYYGNYAAKEDADIFFEEYVAKYPDDPSALSSYIRRIIRDKGPVERGIELSDKLSELTSWNPDPYDAQNRAELFGLKGDEAKVNEIFGPEFIRGQVSNLAYVLASYTRFWLDKNANLESAASMIELATELEPDTLYILQTAATLYLKSGREAKALEIYGPEVVRKSGDEASPLYSYAYFWNREGKNLESAAEAIEKSISLEPYYYKYDVLAQIRLKQKNYEAALAAAEEALALARNMAKTRPGFPTKAYEDRIKAIRAAMEKDKK